MIRNFLDGTSLSLMRLLQSVALILFLYLTRYLIVRFIIRKVDDVKYRYKYSKGTSYFLLVLGLFLIGRIWISGVRDLATFLGIFSAGLAFIFKDLLMNIVGWIFILLRRPFVNGDRVEINGIIGDVIDIRFFMFTMVEVGNWVEADQSTGRIVHVPNSFTFTKALYNYNQGLKFIWNEIPVLITFESHWKKGKAILEELSKTCLEKENVQLDHDKVKTSSRFMIYYKHLEPKIYTKVEDSGVTLTIRYLCDPKRRRATEEIFWENILERFYDEPDIEFAYPTTRFYNRDKED